MDPLQPLDSQVQEEIKKKFDQIKKDLEKFKDLLLKDYKKNLVGVVLLPPKQPDKNFQPLYPGEKPPEIDKNAIDVLVLLSNPADKKVNKYDFADRVSIEAGKMVKGINDNIKPQVLLLDELKENCFDGKYELLRLISVGVTIYDPKDFLAAIRISEVHKSMVLRKFDKYIVSYVAAGSLFRGDKKSNDIDVYVVVDDTDVKRMSRFELKDKLRAIIIGQGSEASRMTGVNKQFHVQTYILTDFWESVKDANPVIFTFLRDGVPLYDRGMFAPWKLLLRKGKITPTPESIESYIKSGAEILDRTKQKLKAMAMEDFHWALITPTQGVLMSLGISAPAPKQAAEVMRKHLVKPGLLEEEYVTIWEDVNNLRKDIEHGKIKDVSAKQIEELLEKSEQYLKRLDKLVKDVESQTSKKEIEQLYDKSVEDMTAALKMIDVKISGNLINTF